MARINKKFFLALSLSACFASLVLVPAVQGYGTTTGSAQTITSGTVNETLYSYDDNAYYKIYCSTGNSISISLAHYSVDLDLYFLSPSATTLSSSTSGSSAEYISYHCTTSGYYYIRVYRCSGSGDAPIVMGVTGATSGPSVPGFDVGILLFVIFSTSALGLVLVKRKLRVTHG
ncbi:MAG: PPC domain-containing protein [Candidatus Lokiarchaeota archaeon]|nr:PPC domain-containing protein [Candidatus Lokiarchaeota archaeon]